MTDPAFLVYQTSINTASKMHKFALKSQHTVNHEGIVIAGLGRCAIELGVGNILKAGTQID